jgi:uncharacterized membrane protein YeiB
MEKFGELIAVLLEHSQRFFDFWNFQILVSLAVLGFVLSNQELVSKRSVRILITLVFALIAGYSVFSLSVHQNREENLWAALESRVQAAPAQYTAEEISYLQSLKPTAFPIKAGALVSADFLVILVTWLSPAIKRGTNAE